MNPLTPTAPRSASSRKAVSSAPVIPPQSAKSTTEPRSAAARLASNDPPSSTGGSEFSGMSITVVVPPAAAARLPLGQPSQSARPGSLKWTCASTAPGRTSSPRASIVSAADTSSSGPTATILPSSTATSCSSPRIRNEISAICVLRPDSLQTDDPGIAQGGNPRGPQRSKGESECDSHTSSPRSRAQRWWPSP